MVMTGGWCIEFCSYFPLLYPQHIHIMKKGALSNRHLLGSWLQSPPPTQQGSSPDLPERIAADELMSAFGPGNFPVSS